MVKPTLRADSVKRRWRQYTTAASRTPVRDFIDGLSDTDKAAVLAAMKEVRAEGLAAARHLEADIYEVRASGNRVIYRILFAPEGATRYSSGTGGHQQEAAEDAQVRH